MISSILSRLVILVFGTLYPAYASYKAVKTKNLKEYVKWMMYWIVFALFTCTETFTDVFLSWFPFYYEIKIILVVWLSSSTTRGSSILYRKFVHPVLSSKEQEIDEYILKAKEQSYKQVLDLGSKGVNVLMQTALKGGGGIVMQLRKSYSLSDLTGSPSDSQIHDEQNETDGLSELKSSTKKRALAASTSSSLYFAEVDVRQDISHIKSTDDISSGYSSGEALYGQVPKLQSREGLVRSGSMVTTRSKSLKAPSRSTAVPKKSSALTDSDESEYESQENETDSEQASPPVKRKGDEKTAKLLETVNTEKPQQLPALPAPKYVEGQTVSLYKSKSVGSLNISTVQTFNSPKRDNERAGKYKKRAAPLPPIMIGDAERKPAQDTTNNQSVSTIRATLVLKPGHVKAEKENSTLSLKLKGKNDAQGKVKQGSPFTRFLTMSKKLHFWNKDEQDEYDMKMVSDLKRSSWNAELPRTAHLLLVNSKPLSKSAENFSNRLKKKLELNFDD